MIPWISTVLLVLQPLGAFAADRCGGARLTEGSAEVLVLLEQTGSAEPVATHVSIGVVGFDPKMKFSGAYEETSGGQIAPTQFFINSSAPTGIPEPHRETIRWRRDDGDWRTLPPAYYGDHRGNFSFPVAQKGPNKGTTYRTEHLEELRRGGRFTVIRLSESGEELVTAFVQYPNAEAVNALYKRARAKAIASLKTGCASTMLVSPAAAK
jgi:hypothetical protein